MMFHTMSTCLRLIIKIIDRFIAYSLIVLIYLIRPMLGPMNVCPLVKSGFEKLGCTQCAMLELQEKSVYIACRNIAKRLLTCHPLGRR